MDSIQTAATMCPGFRRVIPKNRDDENRVEAIEKELIKLGSEVGATNQDTLNQVTSVIRTRSSVRVSGFEWVRM